MLSAAEIAVLEQRAFAIRKHIISTIVSNGEGHAGSALSCADILAVLYFRVLGTYPAAGGRLDRDRFILSAGHKCLALYGALVEKGLVPREALATYNQLHSPLPGHPDMKKLAGVEFSTGSLGHGLSVGCGMALAALKSGYSSRVFVLLGDGEHGEGSVWEAAMFAAHHRLGNLTAIVDRNGLQINGPTRRVLNTAVLEDKYAAFGWRTSVVDGHNIAALTAALSAKPDEEKRPRVVIADTIKGKGLSFAENNYKYHHWHPTDEEARQALEECAAGEERWRK